MVCIARIGLAKLQCSHQFKFISFVYVFVCSVLGYALQLATAIYTYNISFILYKCNCYSCCPLCWYAELCLQVKASISSHTSISLMKNIDRITSHSLIFRVRVCVCVYLNIFFFDFLLQLPIILSLISHFH